MAHTRDDLTTDIFPHFFDVRLTHMSVWGNSEHVLGTTLSTPEAASGQRVLAPIVLLDRAKQFSEAADVLVSHDDVAAQMRNGAHGIEKLRLELEGSNHLFVIYFLYGRSIELALKAFLSCRGKTESELKNRSISHSLTACLAEAERLGLEKVLPLNEWYRAIIYWISEPYAGKDFEYAKVTSGGARVSEMPDVLSVRLVAGLFMSGLRPVCLRSTIFLPPSRE